MSGTRVVALTEHSAAGAPAGAVFQEFSPPVMGSTGGVVFKARLASGPGGVTSANDDGIWAADAAGVVSPVAMEGGEAPGTGGGAFAALGGFAVSRVGGVALRATLRTGTGGVDASNDVGVWGPGAGGGLELVAREGWQAPGTAAGTLFGGFGSSVVFGPAVSASGGVAFFGVLQLGTGDADATNRTGLWAPGEQGDLDLLLRQGDVPPGAAPGSLFIGADLPLRIDDQGGVAFHTLYHDGEFGTLVDGIWGPDGVGSLQRVARRADQAPGAASVPTVFDKLSIPALSGDGRVAFRADLIRVGDVTDGNDSGIWAHDVAGDLQLVAREGDPAPGLGGGVRFSGVSIPRISRAGVAFEAALDDGVDDAIGSLWGADGVGGIRLLAAEGDAAPGFAGVSFLGLGDFALNDRGDVAFEAILGGDGIDSSNDEAIVIATIDGRLRVLVREGESVEVSPGVFLPIVAVGALDVLSLDSPDALNDRREIAFGAGLAGGMRGVFAASLPEPAGLALAGVAASVLAGRRRGGDRLGRQGTRAGSARRSDG
jgi:hypothetical protein